LSVIACSPAIPALPPESTAAESAPPGKTLDEPPTATAEGAGQSNKEETVVATPQAPSAQDPAQLAMVRRAQADLIGRTDVRPSEIKVVSVEAVEWRNTSLGCPQPDMMYAQVITPGYVIVLEAGSKTYEYHTDQRTKVVLCGEPESDGALAEGNSPPENSFLDRMAALAQGELAERLGIETTRIQLLDVQEVTWSDASLGCPDPEMRYAQVPQDGLLIRLGAQGRVYEYHSGAGRDPFLCQQPSSAPKAKRTPIDLVPPPNSEKD
jgi:hypothetical protein